MIALAAYENVLFKKLSRQHKNYKTWWLLICPFFFNFNPFWANVPRKFRDLCVLGTRIETSQFILLIKSDGWFTMELQDCKGHWTGGTFAQIVLMYLFDSFIYLYTVSVYVPGRQFLEYNYKYSYNKCHDN